MKYTITITCEQTPEPHPCTMLQHAALGFHPTYRTYRQKALRAYDMAAMYQEELAYVQRLFGIDSHLMRAGR